MNSSRIRLVNATIVDVPLRRTYRFGDVSRTSQPLVIVRLLTDDGVLGLGEGGIPLDVPDASAQVETIKSVIDRLLAPAVTGMTVTCPKYITEVMDAVLTGHTAAKAAIEGAVYDAWARTLDVSLHCLLGGACQTSIPLTWLVLPTDPIEAAMETNLVAQTAGYRYATIRIPGTDEVAVAYADTVASHLESRAKLSIDVAGGWPAQSVLAFSERLVRAGVDLINQPCQQADWNAMNVLSENLHVKLGIDESLADTRCALDFAAHTATNVFGIDPRRCGGLRNAQSIAAIAEATGIGCRVGTPFAGQIGTATSLQLAATIESPAFGADLYGPLLQAESLVAEPLVCERGEIALPHGPGIGVELDPSRIQEYARA